jgi:hypothetical protein
MLEQLALDIPQEEIAPSVDAIIFVAWPYLALSCAAI